jgi:hypothetical protein
MNRPTRRSRIVAAFRFAALVTLFVAAAPRGTQASSPVASPHGAFQAECSLCHGAKGWSPARISPTFDHASYGYALEGAHRKADCRACHQSLEFSKAETACASCHLDPHRGELGVACEQCHTPKSFLDRAAMTRRHQETRFPLIGAHVATDCARCHEAKSSGALQFVTRSSLCQSCHLSDYQSTTDPNHASSGFSLQCESCHRPVTWHTSSFDHAASGFPLTGAHRTAACTSCHVGSSFGGLSTACITCHQADYDGTTDPKHSPTSFPFECASCHGTDHWKPAAFDHAATAFPLTGAHRTTACASCHLAGVYAGTSSACVSCHQSDYDSTTNPNHAQTGLSTDCASCHGTSAWDGNFTQHDALYFPIYSGAHLGRWSLCADCHTQPSNFTSFSCIDCHAHSDEQITSGHHSGVQGYQYTSLACYSCHPQGRH